MYGYLVEVSVCSSCIIRAVLLFAGSCFLRTDQLDGETDWKLRLPVACTQRLPTAAVSHEGPMERL